MPISVRAAGGCRPFDEIRLGFRLLRNGIAELSGPSLVALPWSLAGDFEYVTIPLTILIAYLVIAAEGIAYCVERPFGQEDDHLDLNSICAASDASVTEIPER